MNVTYDPGADLRPLGSPRCVADTHLRLPANRRRSVRRGLFGIVALNYRLPAFRDHAIVSGKFTNPKKQQNQGVKREGEIA
jgi:hypothetical protein